MSTASTEAAPVETARPCPDCDAPHIGNRRGACGLCNSFARRVERATARALREDDPERHAAARERAERHLYTELLKGRS